MRLLLLVSMLLYSGLSFGQSLSDYQKDSIRNIMCGLTNEDQAIRRPVYFDSMSHYYSSAQVDSIINTIDSIHFVKLTQIIRQYGYPGKKVLGEKRCTPLMLLIHWSKGVPKWFNSDEMVNLFKREIKAGNLLAKDIGQAIDFYIGYMDTDMKLFEMVNKARIAYGLKPYTEAQYQKKEQLDTSDWQGETS